MAQEEILDTVERLQKTLEALTSRGLRMATQAELGRLSILRDELAELGVGYLRELMDGVLLSIQSGERRVARDLLNLQANLHVFERLLSREAALVQIRALKAAAQGEEESRDGEALDGPEPKQGS